MKGRTILTILFLGISVLFGGIPNGGNLGAENKNTHPVDPVYAALRNLTIGETQYAEVADLTLKKDVGTFTFRTGRLVLLPPVEGRVTGAVFQGRGEFLLEPATAIERNYLKVVHGSETIKEPFTSVIFRFTDSTLSKLKEQLTFKPGSHAGAADDFERHKQYLREKWKWNIHAEILSGLYDESAAGDFYAFIKGNKYEKLLFSVNPRGTIAGMGPEEVSLVNYKPKRFGIWYLSHLETEWDRRTASSDESKFVVDVTDISVDSTVSGGEKLTAQSEISFTPLVTGPRVLNLGLVPVLQVSRIADEDDRELIFIQEDKKKDGDLYVIFPDPLRKSQPRKIKVEYSGREVIRDAGGGNFYVGLRTSWYPSLNTFNDYATYDLTFRVPKKYQLVATGHPVEDRVEEKLRITVGRVRSRWWWRVSIMPSTRKNP